MSVILNNTKKTIILIYLNKLNYLHQLFAYHYPAQFQLLLQQHFKSLNCNKGISFCMAAFLCLSAGVDHSFVPHLTVNHT